MKSNQDKLLSRLRNEYKIRCNALENLPRLTQRILNSIYEHTDESYHAMKNEVGIDATSILNTILEMGEHGCNHQALAAHIRELECGLPYLREVDQKWDKIRIAKAREYCALLETHGFHDPVREKAVGCTVMWALTTLLKDEDMTISNMNIILMQMDGPKQFVTDVILRLNTVLNYLDKL